MRKITTERLRLVPVARENAGVVWKLYQQADLRTYQDLPDVEVAQFIRTVAARPSELAPGVYGRFEWLIYLEGVSEPAGFASLRIGERSAASAEVGYSVVSAYRNRGIASEAIGALIAEAFAVLHLRRVRAYCVPENSASRVVLHRVGFESDGVLPHGATVQGQAVDVLGFVLERARWESRTSALP
ncbi:MAG: GNAT family N-acetyltransferase [Candidatus Baltobacteraceae bacterium]